VAPSVQVTDDPITYVDGPRNRAHAESTPGPRSLKQDHGALGDWPKRAPRLASVISISCFIAYLPCIVSVDV
jgi:hypothetical protein